MSQHHIKLSGAGVWIIACLALALGTGAWTVPAWVAVTVVALMPPVLMFLLWQDPPQTVAQIIRAEETRSSLS